jgi:hypothetical protein
MKSKNFFLILTLFVSQITFAQLKVDQYGRIGMGTNWTNSEFKCHIKGNLLLTNYPATPWVELRMKVTNNGNATIGSGTDRILFWTEHNGYNYVYGTRFYNMSDSSTKENIVPINQSLKTIKKLKSYSYNYKNELADSLKDGKQGKQYKQAKKNKSFGYLAQEVEKFLPEIVDTAMGYKMIDYTAIIPILTEAIKEQQAQIETLQSIVHSQEQDLVKIKENYKDCCTTKGKQKDKSNLKSAEIGNATDVDNFTNTINSATLFENSPNPFTVNTEIQFFIPEESLSARLIVHDLQGIEIKSMQIYDTGNSSITINGSELKPGMYLYTLLVDNDIIDTKRMLLTKD